jgi:hypothetical protein
MIAERALAIFAFLGELEAPEQDPFADPEELERLIRAKEN